MEEKLQNSLYKIELHWIKIIPMVMAAICFADTLFSYFNIDLPILSYLGGNSILTILFLYLSSYVFKFCSWHRMFLHYIVINNVVNWYDYEYGIPLDLKTMIVVQISIALIFITIGLYLHQHDKNTRKRNCGKAPARIRK